MGGIEAEAVMLGQPISMVLPQVIGYRLTGNPHPLVTSTDIVLTITKVTPAASAILESLRQPGRKCPTEWPLLPWALVVLGNSVLMLFKGDGIGENAVVKS